jgi:DNA excision repair protein ERCC-3
VARRAAQAPHSLTEEEIGEYSGQRKEIRPVTIATYQVMTTKRKGVYAHLELFDARDWGLIVYDEVHLLPAPIFRMTADLQARRRLGLTATLVREDGREGDVFSLIGPKRYDAPWKDIEAQGWIAPADCVEVRVTLPDAERLAYAMAEPEERYRIASTRGEDAGRRALVERHAASRCSSSGSTSTSSTSSASTARRPGDQGRDPGRGARSGCSTPSAPGRSRPARRVQGRELLHRPARGERGHPGLGTFGSRQEEAQRLGRGCCAPRATGAGPAHFYTVVARDTVDADFAAHRQRFLAEQGYAYRISVDADDVPMSASLGASRTMRASLGATQGK